MKKWTENPSTHFLEQVLDSSHDLIFIKNDRFEILYANRSFLELYPPEVRGKIIGSTTVENFAEAEADLFLAKDRQALDEGYSQAVEQIIDYSGKQVTLVTKKTRFVDDNGIVRILDVAADVSDLVEQTRKLSESNKVLERFATLTAHDLASPLGTASLMLQMLSVKSGIRDDAAATAAITEVVDVLQGSSANIGSILVLQKAILTGALDRQIVDLQSIALTVKTRLRAALSAASARLEIADLPSISCHPVLIEALLQNLIENSIKYRSSTDPMIIVSSEGDSDGVVIAIEDNGIGISTDKVDRVFGEFEQSDRAQPGLGVGLSLCRGIVEAHGGSIWIDTGYPNGTRIRFTLECHSDVDGDLQTMNRTEHRPSGFLDKL